jgi:hypothetical protein
MVTAARRRTPTTSKMSKRVTLIWGFLFLNVLAFTKLPTVIPIPSRIGQAVAQGALAVALVLAVTVNPKVIIRPNVFLVLFSVIAITAVMMSVRVAHVGTDLRAVRLVVFVAVLWLLTPWWGRSDLLLARAHLRMVTIATVSVAVGLVLAHHKAVEAGGRLGGAVWPMYPPGAAHYAALAAGMTILLWLCGLVTRRHAAILVPVCMLVLLLTRTRTALLALLLALLIAGGSLLVRTHRARMAFVTLLVVVVVVGPVATPAVTHWLKRGESTQQLSSLTGRTDAWHLVLSNPRPETNKILGDGITNDSVNGLPIDDSWLSLYQNSGLVGDILIGAMLVLLILAAGFAPPGPSRALALFLTVFCLVSSFTETGLGNASPYMLDLTVAAALLAPVMAFRLPSRKMAQPVPLA